MTTEPDISLAAWLLRRAERTPARAALTYQGETWTYAELARRVRGCAGQLRDLGVGRGDRVAYVDLNNASFLVALFATARLGAIFVPLNFRLTGPELAYMLEDSGARVVIAGREHRSLIGEGPARLSADEAAEGWPALAEDDPAEPLSGLVAGPGDVALIMYTSGTTGRPKGAMLTHANVWWNNASSMHTFDVLTGDVTLTVMPLFHIGALNALSLVTLQVGGHVVLHRSFEPVAALEALQANRITTMMAVPAAYQALAELPGFASADLSALRLLICGAAPCPVPLLQRYAARGTPMVQGWGMTECAPIATFLTAEFAETKAGSAGVPPLLCDVRLVDAEGELIEEPGVPGEAQVRGPNVMAGYWNRPEETAAALSEDGWLRSGDVAFRDADGFFFICDRVKDMIISGGENVYSAEVESVLSGHPALAEVAIVGEPHERWGETVVAVGVLREGSVLTVEELREWAGAQLARYKLPTRLVLVPELPRNATGKVLKFELREQLTAAPSPGSPA